MNLSIKTTIILLLTLLVSISAEEMRYKVIFPKLQTLHDYEAYQLLLDYQRQDPKHCNTYYQIGLICQQWMRKYDPFIYNEMVRDNIKNGKLFFSLAFKYLDEREARKYTDYYLNVVPKPGEKEPDYEDIRKDMYDRLDDIATFEANLAKIENYFVLAVTKYNLCINTFRDINLENSRLKDLYFMVDSGLQVKIAALKTNFDSTIYYFEALKKAIKVYPIGNYNPEYKLVPVGVYRLHGLTLSNFLSSEVVLWNFKQWVDGFNLTLNTDIDELNQRVVETDILHNNLIKAFLDSMPNKRAMGYRLNPVLINKIGKYDFKSAVVPLFLYQESKIKFLANNKSVFRSILKNQKVYQYQQFPDEIMHLADLKKQTDSMLSVFKYSASKESFIKYPYLFQNRYNGVDGAYKYIESQKANNDSIFKSAIQKYTNNILIQYSTDTSLFRPIVYKKNKIFQTYSLQGMKISDGYYTHYRLNTGFGKYYISGSYVHKSDIQAFVAAIDTINSVLWLKTYKPSPSALNYGSMIIAGGDAYFLIITTVESNGNKNYLLTLDEVGNKKAMKELCNKGIPRSYYFDEINQKISIVFKGKDFNPFAFESDSVSLVSYDFSGNALWEKRFQLDGYISNILKINDQLYVYGGYNKLGSADKQIFTLNAGKCNAFSCVFDGNGTPSNTKVFNTDNSYVPIKISKINSDNIDIVAISNINSVDLFNQNQNNISANSFYMLTSPTGIVKFKF